MRAAPRSKPEMRGSERSPSTRHNVAFENEVKQFSIREKHRRFETLPQIANERRLPPNARYFISPLNVWKFGIACEAKLSGRCNAEQSLGNVLQGVVPADAVVAPIARRTGPAGRCGAGLRLWGDGSPRLAGYVTGL